ncbi:MAG TPA: DUF6328 family protein [Propionibacteriaceae bacterium]|nr:DUF6328 family protein [Propionibacteriaceae bacterium]
MTARANARRSAGAEADPADGRNETVDEQMDRNWNEMLQELRVTQTGTQILTGFLLAIAFQSRFAELTRFQHGIYLALVSAAVLTTILGLAPVNLHRVLFRQHAKKLVVDVAHVLLRLTLGGVGLVLVGTVMLIFDVVLDRRSAVVAAAVTGVVLTAIAVLPHVLRRIRPDENGWKA